MNPFSSPPQGRCGLVPVVCHELQEWEGSPSSGFSQEMGAGHGHRGDPSSPLMGSPCTALLRWLWGHRFVLLP